MRARKAARAERGHADKREHAREPVRRVRVELLDRHDEEALPRHAREPRAQLVHVQPLADVAQRDLLVVAVRRRREMPVNRARAHGGAVAAAVRPKARAHAARERGALLDDAAERARLAAAGARLELPRRDGARDGLAQRDEEPAVGAARGSRQLERAAQARGHVVRLEEVLGRVFHRRERAGLRVLAQLRLQPPEQRLRVLGVRAVVAVEDVRLALPGVRRDGGVSRERRRDRGRRALGRADEEKRRRVEDVRRTRGGEREHDPQRAHGDRSQRARPGPRAGAAVSRVRRSGAC